MLFSIFQNNPLSEENKKRLTDSQCGRNKENKVLVCCPNECVHPIGERNFTIDDRLAFRFYLAAIPEPCLTPSYQDGIYEPFKSCKVLYDLFLSKPISSENKRLLQESKHPRTKNDKIWVCCPLPPKSTTTTSTTKRPSATTEHPGNYKAEEYST